MPCQQAAVRPACPATQQLRAPPHAAEGCISYSPTAHLVDVAEDVVEQQVDLAAVALRQARPIDWYRVHVMRGSEGTQLE